LTEYGLLSEPRADLDVEAAFAWYENERLGLGLEFLDELRAAYHRITNGPFGYPDVRSGIRRALLRRLPYAVYFAIDEEIVLVIAVLHVSRDPAEWQRRRD
jgi:toxin ParE1/3/4